MVDVIVMASVVCHIKRIELPVFDHWPNVGLPMFFTQVVSIIPFVSGNGLQSGEIPREYLPPDVGVVRLLHRTVNIQYGTGFAVYQRCCFYRSERVIRSVRVVTAG